MSNQVTMFMIGSALCVVLFVYMMLKEKSKAAKLDIELARLVDAHAASEASKDTLSTMLDESQSRLAKSEEKNDALNQRNIDLMTEHARLESRVESDRENFEKQRQQFEETKASMKTEFENLANKIFEDKGKSFATSSEQSINSMLKPFRDQIDSFQLSLIHISEPTRPY